MGVCINCIYHEEGSGTPTTQKKCGRREFFRKSGHECTHPDNLHYDYVTGATSNGDCYILNQFEECLKFDDGKEEKHYYAWKLDDSIVYTFNLPATADEDYYADVDEEAVGKVKEAPQFYAWVFEDETDPESFKRIFTKTETPEAGDFTYTQDNAEEVEIDSVDEDSIIIADIVYKRAVDLDFLNGYIIIDDDHYIRDEDDDIIRREDRPEEDPEEENPDDTEGSDDENPDEPKDPDDTADPDEPKDPEDPDDTNDGDKEETPDPENP